MDILETITQEPSFTNLPNDIKALILKVAKPAVGIEVNIANQPLPLTTSKFAGVPFIVKGDDLPRDTKNRPYFLLAQFNFDEIRQKVGQHPQLPTTGLLQIFIPTFDPDHGSIEESSDDKYVVRFYRESSDSLDCNDHAVDDYRQFLKEMQDYFQELYEIEQEVGFTEANKRYPLLDFYQKYGDEPYPPIKDECELILTATLSKPESSVDMDDYSEYEAWEAQIGEEGKAYFEQKKSLHRLLGFAQNFVQGDPRVSYTDEEDMTNLHLFLEINSQYGDNIKAKYSRSANEFILWWDVGCAHFFIDEKDLQNLQLEKMELCIEGC